jgi:hypothetical protein
MAVLNDDGEPGEREPHVRFHGGSWERNSTDGPFRRSRVGAPEIATTMDRRDPARQPRSPHQVRYPTNLVAQSADTLVDDLT